MKNTLIIKELCTEQEYELYRDSFYKSLGDISSNTKMISIDYLKASEVFGVFNKEGDMLAGYTLGKQSPLRLLDFVPPEAELSLPQKFKWDDCCEVVCVWKKKEVNTFYTAHYFWPHILGNVLTSKKKYLLGHNQSKRLDSYYSLLGPKSLYSGVSTYGLPSNLFIYGMIKIRCIRYFSLTLYSIIQFFKNRK